MQTDDVVIRLKALDGTWETAGRDRFPAVVPESLTYTYNEWGPDTANFTLRRQPGDLHPDLSAFTDVEIEVGGVKTWTGRVKETPTREGSDFQIAVVAEGWQYALDDDVYERTYVHSNLNDWQDIRSSPFADLTRFAAGAEVSNDNGVIVLRYPNGQPVTQNGAGAGGGTAVGVRLDLGPGNAAKRVVLEFENLNFAATFYTLSITGSDRDTGGHWDSTAEQAAQVDPAGAGASPLAGTFTTPRRYVNVFLFRSGASGTESADRGIRIKAIKVFTDAAYESNGGSIFRAHHGIRDAVDTAAWQLTRTGVEDTSFNIEEFVMSGAKTPREVITALNSYHDYLTYVDVEKDVKFRPKPSAAKLLAGAAAVFTDASANSGEEIYNKARVEAHGPDGQPIRVTRHAAESLVLSGERFAAFPNSDFTTDLSSWTISGPLVRDTAQFFTSPASARIDGPANPRAHTTLTGTFLRGVAYQVKFVVKATAGDIVAISAVLGSGWNTNFGDNEFGLGGDANRFFSGFRMLDGNWNQWSVGWVPKATYTGTVKFGFEVSTFTADAWIDAFTIESVEATILDRRGIFRTKILPVQSRLTETAATQIADIYLQGHRTTPMKGTLSVPALYGLTTMTGEPVPPAEVGLYNGELIRLGHLIDPDTGGLGRDGRLVGGAYTHADRQFEAQIDNRRGNFEAFLERLAVVTAARGVR